MSTDHLRLDQRRRRHSDGHVQIDRVQLDGIVMISMIQQHQHHVDQRGGVDLDHHLA
jgi:hypothetical protein